MRHIYSNVEREEKNVKKTDLTVKINLQTPYAKKMFLFNSFYFMFIIFFLVWLKVTEFQIIKISNK